MRASNVSLSVVLKNRVRIQYDMYYDDTDGLKDNLCWSSIFLLAQPMHLFLQLRAILSR